MLVNKIIKQVVWVIGILVIILLTMLNIIYLTQISATEITNVSYFGIINNVISIVIALILLGFGFLGSKIKISKRRVKNIILSILILFYAAIQIVWIHHSIAYPFADSEVVIRTAKEFLGNKALTFGNYMQYYPQQITLSAVFAFVYKICNTTNFIVLEYLNVISNVAMVIGLYFITKFLSKKYNISETMFFILTLTFIPVILLCTFIYGDFIGFAALVWAVYCIMQYTNKKKIRYGILSGILMGLACLVRMNYSIGLIAIVIYLVLDFLEDKQKKYLEILKKIAIIVLIGILTILPSSIVKAVYLTKYDLKGEKSFSTIPYIYMGMTESERGNGWYSPEMGDIVNQLMGNPSNSNNVAQEIVMPQFKERLQYLIGNPMYTIKFYIYKLNSMWAEPTMAFDYYNHIAPPEYKLEEHKIANEILTGKTYQGIIKYQKALIFLLLIGTMITLIVYRKRIDKNILLLVLIFLGGFSFHILWEAKSRYILPYLLILIPIATIGLKTLLNWKKEGKENEKSITSHTDVL